LNKEEWRKQIDAFLAQMTDDVIESSLRRQPTEIQQYRMQEIVNTLKERRSILWTI
jgi:hypothetical protein